MGLISRRLGVVDLARTSEFYVNCFGFSRDGDVVVLEGKDVGAVGAQATMQRLVDANGAVLELIHLDQPKTTCQPKVRTIAHLGLTHLAFLIDAIDVTRPKVLESGGKVLDHTRVNMLGEWNGMYVSDPDGTRIEIVEGTGAPFMLSHSGLTVRNLEESIEFYKQFGFDVAESYDMREPQGWMAQINEEPGIALFAQMMRDAQGHTLQLLDISVPDFSRDSSDLPFDSLGFFELVIDSTGAPIPVRDPQGVRLRSPD